MLNLICFSKNRPMQLQATLDSLELHTKGFFNNIDVLYKSDDEFREGYEILKKRKPNVNFIEQSDFQKDLLGLFKYDYTCFAADDDIFYKDFNKGLFKEITEDVVCFSLRLGLNINYCYSNDRLNTINRYKDRGEFIKLNWREQELDFGYPLSVVSHIFRTTQIKALSEKEAYNNPNQYESSLQRHLEGLQGNIAAYKQSRVFGVPANRVNDTHQNRNGLTNPYSTEELNKMYLDGKIIKIDKDFDITACQQEIQYEFVDILGG